MRRLLRTLLATACLVTASTGTAAAQAPLDLVAAFEHQVTGVTASDEGRIFVNFPRWTEDVPVSVAEVGPGGELTPYPDEDWNAWRNTRKYRLSPATHFVSVQSVVADGDDLWVLDPAAPAQGRIVVGGPKLVRIDLATDEVEQVIRFSRRIAPQGSYLNDVRFSPDGRHAYITDSGARGAIVVVDLRTERARRVLDGHPSTQIERDVVVTADGAPLLRPDGRRVEFAADGIALTNDGRTLYWQALTGETLYGVPTAVLEDRDAMRRAVVRRVERVGRNGVADGLLIDRRGRMYVSAVEENAVKVREGTRRRLRGGDRLTTLVQDARLRWPDTFAEAPDGSILVTTSRIQDSAFFDPLADPSLPTQLWRLSPAP